MDDGPAYRRIRQSLRPEPPCCHRVAVMEAGKVVEEGDVLEVFRNPRQEVTKRFVKEVAQHQ